MQLDLHPVQIPGSITIVDLHVQNLASAVYSLLNHEQANSLALTEFFAVIELNDWITRQLPPSRQFSGGLPAMEAIRHVTQNLRSELIISLTGQWLAQSMEKTQVDRVVDIKTIWNGFSQAGTESPMLVLALLLSGEKVRNDYLKSILGISSSAAQKIIPRDDLYRISGMPAGSVCLFIMPAGGTEYKCAMEQQILDQQFMILASSTSENPFLYITGGGSPGVQIVVTERIFARHVVHLQSHVVHLQSQYRYASGSFRDTGTGRKAN